MGGMDQFDFVRTLKKIQSDVGYEGPLFICRDHGGPWQRNMELDNKYSLTKAMEIARVCGHYIYDDPQAAAAKDQLFKNSRRFHLVENPEHFVIEKQFSAIGFYVKHFKMEGINRIAGRYSGKTYPFPKG